MRKPIFVGLLIASAASVSWAAQPTTRPSDEQRGETLYRRHCVSCHGVRNGGQGPATTALVHLVPALQGKVEPNEVGIKAVLKGKGAMPGFEASFDRADAVRVLKYMKSLGPTKALPDRPVKGISEKVPPKKLEAEPVEDGPMEEGPERENEE
ncbi:MAG: cytochrome c [Alphaproteobacteria bacterium]|nr:cytochrome c [Alphaproteobacteria bacterium]